MNSRSIALNQANIVQMWLRILLSFIAAVSLSGCAVQLAPDYDAQLLDGLVAANKDALVLFAKVETGSDKSEFAKYSDEYANAIASFEALRQRAEARQNPPLATRLAKMPFFAAFCDPKVNPEGCLNATSSALHETVDTLRMLRDRHRDTSLSREGVQFLRGRYDVQIHQALTVETALKR